MTSSRRSPARSARRSSQLGTLQPVRFIVNTHYHFDHTDGNLPWQEDGAVVIAQDNLRTRLASGGLIGNGGSISREVKPVVPGALPLLTYEEQLTVHLNGEDMRVHHYPHAHTDGDSVVFFAHAGAVHMGDIFVRYGFPFIDTDGGGTVQGMIAACEEVIKTVPADTKIIPGHGEVATIADLREYTKMLADTSALVARAVKARQDPEADAGREAPRSLERALLPAEGFRGYRRLHAVALQLLRQSGGRR